MSYNVVAWRWDRASPLPGDPSEVLATINDSPPQIVEIAGALTSKAPMPRLPILPMQQGEVFAFLGVLDSTGLGQLPFETDLVMQNDGQPDSVAWIVFAFYGGSEVKELAPLAARAHSANIALFDPAQGRLVDPCAPKSHILEVEGQSPKFDPKFTDVTQALESLNVHSGPSFFVLQNWTGAFVQVAGSREALTLEWRDASGHWIGHRPGPSGPVTAIPTLTGQVTVLGADILSAAMAEAILAQFLRAQARPNIIQWRPR